jgi:hypothetical protein
MEHFAKLTMIVPLTHVSMISVHLVTIKYKVTTVKGQHVLLTLIACY